MFSKIALILDFDQILTNSGLVRHLVRKCSQKLHVLKFVCHILTNSELVRHLVRKCYQKLYIFANIGEITK